MGRGLQRSFGALAALACLLVGVAGCGSSTSTSGSAGATQGTESASISTPTTTQSTTQAAGNGQNGQGNSTSSSGSGSSSNSGPVKSIETYGSAANSAQKVALHAAAFSFFRALAVSDYAKVCSDLSSSYREQLQTFLKSKPKKGGGCALVLPTIIQSSGPEARRAAAGTLNAVRVKGDTSFVLFRPKGGKPSYFVMKREGGSWKAIGLAPGTPINPLGG
jgi:hypothetical protein